MKKIIFYTIVSLLTILTILTIIFFICIKSNSNVTTSDDNDSIYRAKESNNQENSNSNSNLNTNTDIIINNNSIKDEQPKLYITVNNKTIVAYEGYQIEGSSSNIEKKENGFDILWNKIDSEPFSFNQNNTVYATLQLSRYGYAKDDLSFHINKELIFEENKRERLLKLKQRSKV